MCGGFIRGGRLTLNLDFFLICMHYGGLGFGLVLAADVIAWESRQLLLSRLLCSIDELCSFCLIDSSRIGYIISLHIHEDEELDSIRFQPRSRRQSFQKKNNVCRG
jgi:hypothetical protein